MGVRPDDWQLYNRIGATMANGGDAGTALQYYYCALELNPSYIRARCVPGEEAISISICVDVGEGCVTD
jgi:peroxin-5